MPTMHVYEIILWLGVGVCVAAAVHPFVGCVAEDAVKNEGWAGGIAAVASVLLGVAVAMFFAWTASASGLQVLDDLPPYIIGPYEIR